MLPMLPVYVSYFAGGTSKKGKVLINSIAFVCGFSLIFCLLGVFSGTVGAFLVDYQTAVNIICGCAMIFFGLSYLGVFNLKLFKGLENSRKISGALSAFVFGLVYSVSLTPCVGAFLGSAIMLASASGSTLRGLLLLLLYSLGLGIPFVISAVLIDRLSGLFSAIKSKYNVINIVCGGFLILIGVLTAFGMMNKFISLF